jgi:hypothetical protein
MRLASIYQKMSPILYYIFTSMGLVNSFLALPRSYQSILSSADPEMKYEPANSSWLMAPSVSSVYLVPISVVMLAFLMVLMPIYPSRHPERIISPLVLMTVS